MKHLHLIIPDLLLPRDAMPRICAGLELPYLSKILARSTRTYEPPRILEEVLCEAFGVQACAPIRAAADGLTIGDAYWMCADPVHIALQQSQAILQPDVLCNAEEANVVCDSLNRHFAQDGITFFAPTPRRWYIRSEVFSNVMTTPLRVASWRDVKSCQPRGGDALRWRSLSNEIQMLLHGHVINPSREARGLQAINSLWLWGGGAAQPIQTNLDVLGGEEALCAPFAKAADLPYCVSLEQMLQVPMEVGVWVETVLATAWQRGDLYAWREGIERVERELARPLWEAVRQGRLQKIILEVSSETETCCFEFDRAASWKLWRGAGSLFDHVV